MSEESQKDSPTQEQLHFQLDHFTVKMPLKPSKSLDDDEPKLTIRKVISSVWQSFLQSVLHGFALIPDCLISGRRIVRGLAETPDAVNQRISGAHQLAEQREERATGVSKLQVSAAARQESTRVLQNVLERLQEKGLAVGISRGARGELIVQVVRPELLEEAQGAITEAVKRAPLSYISITIGQLASLGVISQQTAALVHDHEDGYDRYYRCLDNLKPLQELRLPGSAMEEISKAQESYDSGVPFQQWPVALLNASINARIVLQHIGTPTMFDLMRVSHMEVIRLTNRTDEQKISAIVELQQRMKVFGVELWPDFPTPEAVPE